MDQNSSLLRIAQSLLPRFQVFSALVAFSQSSRVAIALTTIYTIFWFFHFLSRTIGLFASISISESQECYPIILKWASQRFQNRTNVEVASIENNAQADANTLPLMPSSSRYLFLAHGRLCTFTRISGESNAFGGQTREATIVLQTLGYSTKPIQDLIKNIRSSSRQNKPCVQIRTLRANAGLLLDPWDKTGTIPPRSLDTVVLDAKLKQSIVDEITAFLTKDAWYRDRGVSWHMGYLLHGPPGTGKTSLIKALATRFSLPIFLLTVPGKDAQDKDILRILQRVPPRSIVVVEDVDAGPFTVNRTTSDSKNNSISFSVFLNLLDGLPTPEGLIFMVTTNHREKLSETLLRPGRIDREIPFTRLTQSQAQDMFVWMYQDQQVDIEELKGLGREFADKIPDEKISPADLQAFLMTKKDAPHDAVESVEAWVHDKERAGKDGILPTNSPLFP
jgi:chaperone BCS1